MAFALLGLLGTPVPVRSTDDEWSPPPEALIVDDTSPRFVQFGPPQWWNVATGTEFSYYGGRMVWTLNEQTQLYNYARWYLPISATLPLTYEVYAFIPRYNATTRNAVYRIVQGTAQTPLTRTRAISQNVYYAEWVSLGQHYFQAGGANYVELTDVTGETTGQRRIAFDAIAFVPISPTATITGEHTVYIPAVIGSGSSQPTFRYTTSRYISTVSPAHHERMGCAAGQNDEQGIVILAFGQAWAQSGQFGVLYYRSNYTFASTAVIANAVKGFLRGYWACASPTAQLKLVVGTNNYRGATGRPHGEAWGEMITQLNAWLRSDEVPPDVASRIEVLGGNDIEMSWNTPTNTKLWVDGYASRTMHRLINFGTCDGCPTQGNPHWQPSNNWTLADILYVNTGIAAPFPEIYLRNGINADQWYRMSSYAYQSRGQPLAFAGLLTQWQACRDVGGCRGTDNTPRQGWYQLQWALNADPRTAMTLPLPSDITWRVITDTLLTAAAQSDELELAQLAVLATTPAGTGAVFEGVAPPIEPSQFLDENAWRGLVNGQVVRVFAGLVRDPALGGADEQAQGGILLVSDADGQMRLIEAPTPARAFRIVGAEGAVLILSDGSLTLRFDLEREAWLE
ncbi:MAG: hypothetical protein NZ693_01740 [Thermoflexales bacterium]|nr:hypothetical protein [Thermoflexales bacterium]